MNNKIEILIPVHNCTKTIKRAIQSIAHQELYIYPIDYHVPELFVTVIDNNSKDDTVYVAEYWLKEFGLNHRILECKEPGIVAALNTGIFSGMQDCDWVARLDGDDMWHMKKIVTQYRFLLKNPHIDILGTQINPVDNVNFKELPGQYLHRPETDDEIKQWLFSYRNPIAHPSVMFKRSILLKTGGYSDMFKIAEDYDLWLRAAKWFTFANLPEKLMDYTISHNPKYNPQVPQLACETYTELYKNLHFLED